jgi:hypothetical protein
MEKKEIENGFYIGHGEFNIGGKFYLVNPVGVMNVIYDDTVNKEKIILEFKNGSNNLEYYCLDGLQLEWNKIKRDFIKFWNTNARDIERCIANSNELKRLGYDDESFEQRMEEIKTCRQYYHGGDKNEKNDGKPHHYTKEQWLAIQKESKEREIAFYKEEKRKRKEEIEKNKEDLTQEEYERDLEWLEKKYAFLSDEEWLNEGLDFEEDYGVVTTNLE